MASGRRVVAAGDPARIVAGRIGLRRRSTVSSEHDLLVAESERLLHLIAGTYRGVGRGVTTVLKVDADSAGVLQLTTGSTPPARPTYTGQDRFERDGTIATFVRVGGCVATLLIDQGYGHHALAHQP